MSTIAATSRSSELEPLRAKSGWIVALGVIYVIAGIIALGSVVMATVASVFVVGIMMLVAGIAEVINAFQVKTWGRFLFWLLLGALYIIAGFVTFENPLLAAVLLTLILGKCAREGNEAPADWGRFVSALSSPASEVSRTHEALTEAPLGWRDRKTPTHVVRATVRTGGGARGSSAKLSLEFLCEAAFSWNGPAGQAPGQE